MDGLERQFHTLDARLQEIVGSERLGRSGRDPHTLLRHLAADRAGLIAAIGDFARFSHPRELASWLGSRHDGTSEGCAAASRVKAAPVEGPKDGPCN